MSKTQPARGMRDFLPADVRKRNYVINIIKEVYEKYGFEPLETPSVENLETLTGKYGEEGNQLMFKILKRGEKLQQELSEGKITDENELSDLALRYDLTVPLARVVANYKNDLPKFFKRYQIQPVWRADRPARGRYREFYQCDVDAIGSSSMIVEAELISAVCEIFEKLGFGDFIIRLNHREILTEILNVSEVPVEKHPDALVALDKLDKIGREGVTKEFIQRGASLNSAEKLLVFFESLIEANLGKILEKPSIKKLVSLKKQLADREELTFNRKITTKETSQKIDNAINKIITKLRDEGFGDEELNFLEEANIFITEKIEGIKKLLHLQGNLFIFQNLLEFLSKNNENYDSKGTDDLLKILNLLTANNYTDKVTIDLSLARGLSYYTGAILEINVPDFSGSLAGGGRYDGLIGMFGKEQIPAVGFSIGLERILFVMEERGMFPENLTTNSADVMITIWNEESAGESLKLANELRRQNLRVLVYPEADKLGKQFKYADSLNIPFVCVLGETELAENKVALKNLKSGEQEKVSREEIAEKINK